VPGDSGGMEGSKGQLRQSRRSTGTAAGEWVFWAVLLVSGEWCGLECAVVREGSGWAGRQADICHVVEKKGKPQCSAARQRTCRYARWGLVRERSEVGEQAVSSHGQVGK
jgi:hypothetical protein